MTAAHHLDCSGDPAPCSAPRVRRPHLLRRAVAVSCDPGGASCWATWTPTRRERPPLVYDTPEAVRDREETRLGVLADIAQMRHATEALQRARARAWQRLQLTAEQTAAVRAQEEALALVARVQVLVLDERPVEAVEVMRDLAARLKRGRGSR